jgi:integrase/recombinase XerD
MTAIAPHLSAFLRDYLPHERGASPHTCETYAYAFQLLVCFAAERLNTQPSALALEQLDAALIIAFLEQLETQRGNSPRTRNARLGAIKAFFRFLEYRLASCLEQARRIHAIPVKKTNETLIDYLTDNEIQALLDAPDPTRTAGIRDQAMLHLAFAAGLRVSELVGLHRDDLQLQPQPTIHIWGKGRRERVLPLWKETTAVLRDWLAVRDKGASIPLFYNAHGQAMTRSGFEYILAKYVRIATEQQPSLAGKRISPHVLRHSCAMHMLQATHDVRKVALWLGHARLQSTEVYLHVDPGAKLETLAASTPPSLRRGQFSVPDKLLALLQATAKDARYAPR